jgi:hypothetical protein
MARPKTATAPSAADGTTSTTTARRRSPAAAATGSRRSTAALGRRRTGSKAEGNGNAGQREDERFHKDSLQAPDQSPKPALLTRSATGLPIGSRNAVNKLLPFRRERQPPAREVSPGQHTAPLP